MSKTQPGADRLQEHGGDRRGDRCVLFGFELHLSKRDSQDDLLSQL